MERLRDLLMTMTGSSGTGRKTGDSFQSNPEAGFGSLVGFAGFSIPGAGMGKR
jgi:hypothetical protein